MVCSLQIPQRGSRQARRTSHRFTLFISSDIEASRSQIIPKLPKNWLITTNHKAEWIHDGVTHVSFIAYDRFVLNIFKDAYKTFQRCIFKVEVPPLLCFHWYHNIVVIFRPFRTGGEENSHIIESCFDSPIRWSICLFLQTATNTPQAFTQVKL